MYGKILNRKWHEMFGVDIKGTQARVCLGGDIKGTVVRNVWRRY